MLAPRSRRGFGDGTRHHSNPHHSARRIHHRPGIERETCVNKANPHTNTRSRPKHPRESPQQSSQLPRLVKEAARLSCDRRLTNRKPTHASHTNTGRALRTDLLPTHVRPTFCKAQPNALRCRWKAPAPPRRLRASGALSLRCCAPRPATLTVPLLWPKFSISFATLCMHACS